MTRGRLCEANLPQLAGKASTPTYDRSATGIGIVHLGVGAFHRAHQAVYTDDVLGRSGGDWGICGVSIHNPHVRDSLAPQDLLYSVNARNGEEVSRRVIGALREFIVAPEAPGALVARLADGAVSVVTLTITEKGYAPGADVLEKDLRQPRRPHTAIAYLVAGLQSRRAAGASGLTFLSCDNLQANGRKLRAAVLEFAAALDPSLPDWVVANCRFPCTMVDRIVPAASENDYRDVTAALGLQDRAAVYTEPFCQWVIESDFAGPVPPWDQVGASFVENIEPFETMKLRMLNASHSCLAYLGCLSARSTVVEALAAPGMEALLRQLMLEEIAPGLRGLGDFDLSVYCQSLLNRFANRGLAHPTAQIAMDGSRKLPQRLLPPLGVQLEQGRPGEATTLAVAAWLQFMRGRRDDGRALVISDPMADNFARLAAHHGTDLTGYLDAVLALDGVFDDALRGDPRIRQALLHWLTLLDACGADAVVTERWDRR